MSKQPKHTLAAAIRRGIPLVPETKHLTFRFDASDQDWADHVAHKKPLIGADALGTALVGLAGDAGKAVERTYDGPEKSPLRILYRLYPELTETKRQCPACLARQEWSPGRPPMMLVALLRHLQDVHGFSREQIAEYLERQP